MEALLITSYSPASQITSSRLSPAQVLGEPPDLPAVFGHTGNGGRRDTYLLRGGRGFRDRSGCGERGCGTRNHTEPAAPASPGCRPWPPHYPRLLPSAGARPGPGSGWLWLRRSRHAAQQDAAAPAAAPQTKPPRKRRWRGKAAMAAAAGRERKEREGAGAAPQRPLTAQPRGRHGGIASVRDPGVRGDAA